jgi:hypothetical protein
MSALATAERITEVINGNTVAQSRNGKMRQPSCRKQQWEEDAKNRFLQFLSATANETWAVLDCDVVVDPAWEPYE